MSCDCFSGNYVEATHLSKTSHIAEMVLINLKECITDTGQLTHPHLYDYARPISHTEETEALLTQSKIRLEPSQFGKESDSGNIEYLVGGENATEDSRFHMNVLKDLWLRYSIIPRDKKERVNMLRKCLEMGSCVCRLRNAFVQYESALRTRKLDPGQVVMCILHAHCRIVEKMVHQLLLAGSS